MSFFFLMTRRPPRSTRTDTRFPYTRSSDLKSARHLPQGTLAVTAATDGADNGKRQWHRISDPDMDRLHFQDRRHASRSEEHTSELQSLMRSSYAAFCLKKKNTQRYKYTLHGTNIIKTT